MFPCRSPAALTHPERVVQSTDPPAAAFFTDSPLSLLVLCLVYLSIGRHSDTKRTGGSDGNR